MPVQQQLLRTLCRPEVHEPRAGIVSLLRAQTLSVLLCIHQASLNECCEQSIGCSYSPKTVLGTTRIVARAAQCSQFDVYRDLQNGWPPVHSQRPSHPRRHSRVRRARAERIAAATQRPCRTTAPRSPGPAPSAHKGRPVSVLRENGAQQACSAHPYLTMALVAHIQHHLRTAVSGRVSSTKIIELRG